MQRFTFDEAPEAKGHRQHFLRCGSRCNAEQSFLPRNGWAVALLKRSLRKGSLQDNVRVTLISVRLVTAEHLSILQILARKERTQNYYQSVKTLEK